MARWWNRSKECRSVAWIAAVALMRVGSAAGPTTTPAEIPATSPKAALTSLNLALRDGDRQAIRSLFVTHDDEGSRLVRAMADYAQALAMLHQAARNAYGPAGANTVTGDIEAQSQDGLSAIEKAEVVITGDTAEIRFRDATDPPVSLMKIGDGWKLPLAQLLDGADRKAEERRCKELLTQAAAARKTADEVKAGKYREGPLKAAEVWRTRLLEPTTRKAKE